MNIISYFGAILVASVVSLDAATIAIFNTDTDGLIFAPVASSNGEALLSGQGVVAIGTYSEEPTSISQILQGFSLAGSTIFGSSSGETGYLAGSIVTVPLIAGGGIVGGDVYVIIGNALTLGDSTEFLLWKATANNDGNVFTADAPVGGPSNITVYAGAGEVIFGSYGTTIDADFGSFPGYTLAVIPEASVSLLGVVATLGLLRRRR